VGVRSPAVLRYRPVTDRTARPYGGGSTVVAPLATGREAGRGALAVDKRPNRRIARCIDLCAPFARFRRVNAHRMCARRTRAYSAVCGHTAPYAGRYTVGTP
jgi:hypothetical protein